MSMNVSFFLIPAFHSRLSDCLGKRLQKYNFFLNSQAFLKKNSFIFFLLSKRLNKPPCCVFQFYNERHSSRFGWAKIQSFFLLLQIFFNFFFIPYSWWNSAGLFFSLPLLLFEAPAFKGFCVFSLYQNLFANAGAKVTLFFPFQSFL